MQKLRFFFLPLFVLCTLSTFSQQDSCRLRISLLTCGQGTELFSIWGHTGIRVTDSVRGTDYVFNYGTFDDTDPYFYLKFTRGIMVYSLSVETYKDFMAEYQFERRNVIEQTLDLSCAAKIKLYQSLQINATEQNRYYNYQFYADNCTSRARDMIRFHSGEDISFHSILPAKIPTYRQLIHLYLDSGHQPWSKLGIDILLGNHLDKEVTNISSMFLPDYLMTGLDSALVQNHPLVTTKKTILYYPDESGKKSVAFTPFVVFTVLFALMMMIEYGKRKGRFLNTFHFILFFLTGLLGLLILVLWLTRVDTVCRDNWNIAWALPTNLVFAFLIRKKSVWVQRYFLLVIAICIVLLGGWVWLPQPLNPALLPIIALLLFSSIRIIQKNRNAKVV